MRIVIYGSRPDGHAKVALELAESMGMEGVGLIDDFPENRDRGWRGLKVLGGREDLREIARNADAVGFGFEDGQARAERVPDIQAAGLDLPVLRSEYASVSPTAEVGVGTQVHPGVRLGPEVVLGQAVLVNTSCVVGHNSVLEDGVTLAAGVMICGRVHIGRYAMIGTSAVLLPDVKIGRSAVVGAGAVVTRDVPDGETVVGVPAKPLRKST